MFENERIGKVDTSREQEFLRKHGLIGEPEQAAVSDEEYESVHNATYWNESNGNRSGHIVEKC